MLLYTADAVLYDRVLPNFSINDELSITYVSANTSTATVAGRRFVGKVGIKTDTIIGYNHTGVDPVFLRVDEIVDATTIRLKDIDVDVNGVMDGDGIASGTLNTNFTIKVPRIVKNPIAWR